MSLNLINPHIKYPTVISEPPTNPPTGGLAQVSGTLRVSINAGETKMVIWKVGSTYQQEVVLFFSVTGNGSEYVTVSPMAEIVQNELIDVEVTVALPITFTQTVELTPTLRALLPGGQVGLLQINLEAMKALVINTNA